MMKKILIIEDDKGLMKMLLSLLTDQGYDVVQAFDAMKGVQLAHKEKPDLILLDIMLPAGDGETVISRVRESVLMSAIPIVVISAIQDEDRKMAILDLDVKAFIHKPFDKDVLLDTIKQHIGD
ncbi:MAG: response regulator [Candidatus Omnitrophica bacterium]|nr:response regulator [Candidatus Omnitrophota bacterium]